MVMIFTASVTFGGERRGIVSRQFASCIAIAEGRRPGNIWVTKMECHLGRLVEFLEDCADGGVIIGKLYLRTQSQDIKAKQARPSYH